ncbi:hypothetical protein V3C99_010400, partial [Haemonchus contortus]
EIRIWLSVEHCNSTVNQINGRKKLSARCRLLILSHFRAEVAASGSNHTIAKRQSKYICGTDPYRFFSDVPCDAYSLCPNGGVKLFIGCTTNVQCQIHNPDTVCIDSCCCTLPNVLETTTYTVFYDSAAFKGNIVVTVFLSLFFIFA